MTTKLPCLEKPDLVLSTAERTLGMRCNITRRDFVNAAALGTGAALLGSVTPVLAKSLDRPNFERGYFYKAYDINIDPDVLFEMVADWENLYWFPSSFSIKYHVVYGEGSKAGKYPCQRLIFQDRSTVQSGQNPEYYDETLYAANFETRTLLYGVNTGLANFNYDASNEIDDLGNGRSRLAFRARFDLTPGGDVNAYVKRMLGADEEKASRPMPSDKHKHTNVWDKGLLARGFEENAPNFIKYRRPELLKYRRK